MMLDLGYRRAWLGYAVAIALAALAGGVREEFLGILGTRVTYITFYPAVVLAALYGGLRCGLVATILSALLASFFWMEPVGQLFIRDSADWLASAIFLMSGTMISGTAEAMHRAQAAANQAEADARLAAEREKAHVELQKFASLADNSAEFVGMCDMNFMPFYINPAGLHLVGFNSLEQARRTPVKEFFFDEDQPFLIETFFPRVLREGRAEVEIRFRHFQTGEALWMMYNVFYIKDASGQSAGLATVSRHITERKRAEEALRDSEQQFRTLANAIPQLCWRANADGWISWYNQRWYAYTGTTPEEMEGWGWQSVHDPEMLPKVLERWKGSIATGAPFEMVFPLRGADGVFRPFLTRVMPVRDGDGKVAGWFGTNTDISEQRKTEAALRESEERLRLAQQVARVGTFEWNIQSGVNRWTPELEAMYGLPPGGFAGTQQMWEELVYPDDRPEAVRRVQAAMETGSFEGEWRVVWLDGTLHWLFGRGWVFRDESGRPLRLIGVNIDITERKQAEAALRESEERFRNMADTAPVLLWVSGTDKLCTFFNKPWLDFTGRSLEQEAGNGWAGGVHPDDFDRCLDIYNSAFDARRSFKMEYRLRRADGEYRWVLDHGIARYREGEFIGFIGSCIDVTEQKLLEERLRANATALRDSERQLRVLAGTVLTAQEDERRRLSRELHDDVTQRLAFLSLELGNAIKEIPDSLAETHVRLRVLQEQTIQLSTEVRRLSHGLHPSVIEDFGLSIALEEFCHQFGIAKAIHVGFDGFVEDSRLDPSGATCLYRVAQESLRNAVAHGRATDIRVELIADGASIQLRVRDNGTGFSTEGTRSKAGLGLISMQERIRFVHGNLTISSQPGQGTEIRASVPLIGVGDETCAHSAG